MSIGEHIQIRAVLELQSSLHVGQAMAGLAETDLRDEEPGEAEVSSMQCDVDSNPWIPGTTAKGVLRNIARQGGADPEHLMAAFGEELHHENETGSPGAVLIHAAPMRAPGRIDQRLEKVRDLRRGTFVATRTSIDNETGAADEHKLFSEQLVARGARFEFRATLMRNRFDVSDGATQVLLSLLATLELDGACFGRGRADGQGWAKLVEVDEVTIVRLNRQTCEIETVDGRLDLATAKVRCQPYVARTPAHIILELGSKGPFFVKADEVDDENVPFRRNDRTGDEVRDDSLLFALRHSDHQPELPGPSLAGALRARAEWLRELQILRSKRQRCVDARLLADDPVVRLFGPTAEELKRARSASGDSRLTGYAARLRILSIEERTTSSKILTSVKIDRFSGAPIDNALFKVKAFVAPTFMVTLALERSDESDGAFLRDLLESLVGGPTSGLFLGGGSNRGFGWFTVEVRHGAQ